MQQNQENLLDSLPEELRVALQGVDHKYLGIVVTLLARLKDVQDTNNKLLLANQMLVIRNQELASQLQQTQASQQTLNKQVRRPLGNASDSITQEPMPLKQAQSTLFAPVPTCVKAAGMTRVLKMAITIDSDKEEWRGVYLEFIDGLHAKIFIESYNRVTSPHNNKLFLDFYPGKYHILEVVPVNDSNLDMQCKSTPGSRGQLLLAEIARQVDLSGVEEVFLNYDRDQLSDASVACRVID